MRRLILFEDAGYRNLLPLVYWRSIGELRCGDGTLMDHLSRSCGLEVTDLWVRAELEDVTRERYALRVNRPTQDHPDNDVLLVNARYVALGPSAMPPDSCIGLIRGQLAFARLRANEAGQLSPQRCLEERLAEALPGGLTRREADGQLIEFPWDLVDLNEPMLARQDAAAIGMRGTVERGAHLVRPDAIAVGPGARISPGAVLDATDGPIVIGEQSVISPLAVVQGPAFIGSNCLIQPGASIRHACAFGPCCKLGGEIEATIIQGYTNKQHDGFLGHAYVGEWANLGADTVNSDLKNTYGSVRVPINGIPVDSGRTFVGMFIGDHAKTGINQSFSTGSVVGFGSSVATSGPPPRFVPSFTWLTDNVREAYDVDRCLAVAAKVMLRRKVSLSPAQEALFRRLPQISAAHERADAEV